MQRADGDFNELARDYDRFRTGYSPDLIDQLVALGFTAGTSVLDVGCGTGLAMEPLAARGLLLTGIDPSTEMLTVAKRRFPHAKFARGTAEAMPFDDRSFDGAVSAQTFHWFDQDAAFRELARVVKAGRPVAIWWKILAADDDVRAFRTAVTEQLGLTPTADPLRGGFGAFYGAPFADRALRVVPMVARFTVDEWLGYERSRAQARNAYGAKRDAYLDLLGDRMRAVFSGTGTRFEVRYIQYLYVGYVAA